MFGKVGEEFKLIFRNPKTVHRVFAMIPLAALTSHLSFLYLAMPKGVQFSENEIITICLGAILYTGWLSWIFLSNELDIELIMRFFWAAVLASLGHRVGVMDNEIGGSLYFKAVSFLAIGTMMVFVITGKTKNELKIWFSMKLDEGKDVKNTKLRSIGSNDDQQSDTG